MPRSEETDVLRVKFHLPEVEHEDTPADLLRRLSPRLLLGAAIVALLTIGLVGLVVWLLRPMGEVTSPVPSDPLEPQAHPVAPALAAPESEPELEEEPTV